MITFVPKTDVLTALEDTEENRFERIRKAAAERRRKPDTDGTRRRARQTAEDSRLISRAKSGCLPEQPASPPFRGTVKPVTRSDQNSLFPFWIFSCRWGGCCEEIILRPFQKFHAIEGSRGT